MRSGMSPLSAGNTKLTAKAAFHDSSSDSPGAGLPRSLRTPVLMNGGSTETRSELTAASILKLFASTSTAHRSRSRPQRPVTRDTNTSRNNLARALNAPLPDGGQRTRQSRRVPQARRAA